MKLQLSPSLSFIGSTALLFWSATTITTVSAKIQDIPATAIAADDFDTLVAALSQADLVGALSSPNGPYTVFAPTDRAFISLPDGLVDCLVLDKNKEVLTDILLYHVVEGKAFSSDLVDGMEIATLLGEELSVDLSQNGVRIYDSNVIAADINASNGVIHAIDKVLVPPSIDVIAFLKTCPSRVDPKPVKCNYLGVTRSAGEYLTGPTHTCLCTSSGHWRDCVRNTNEIKSIEKIVVTNSKLSTLETAIRAAGLLGVLDGSGSTTLFAPDDRAFSRVPQPVLEYLLANTDVLSKVLQYHVLPGKVSSNDVAVGTSMVPSSLGVEDSIDIEKSCWSAVDTCHKTFSIALNGDSDIIAADIYASNGIIHVIDEVLIPPTLQAAVQSLVESI
uniref:FAS1 domain-containing protein n=1 Tax=Pseudo-nitzschia australis TaxID=44445 RepID=A0A7S4EQH9_9STRA|mmetsp:Transcript_10484/g.22302  ORF Transcript_10484/g.22302 Transcript_10484/m.22302 type:complete len:389 (-) Transcript_10484:211-1377(-)